MKQLLVLGGTRFFGKKVVAHFLTLGYEVTIATRGVTLDSFGTSVNRIILDRHDGLHQGWGELRNHHWDVVLDNIAYTWEDIDISLSQFTSVGHYLFTSSLAVYEGETGALGYTEDEFNPSTYTYIPSKNATYGEGKRQAENYLEKNSPYPTTYLRFPVVLDEDDYTERLTDYIRLTIQQKPIYFSNNFNDNRGEFSFVKASEIPEVLSFIVTHKVTGPLNIGSITNISTKDFINSLEFVTGKSVVITEKKTEPLPPFSNYDKPMNSFLLKKHGYTMSTLESWLPNLMAKLYEKEHA